MSLIGRRVVFAKGNDRLEGQIIDKVVANGFELYCIEADNCDAHFVVYGDIVSFVNKKKEPKTVRIMANDFRDFDVDFDRSIFNPPAVGDKLRAEFLYNLDWDTTTILLVTKVEHKANGLVCVYVEPVND